MPQIDMPYTVHLDNTLRVTPLSTLFSKGDNEAHRFILTIMRGGVQEDLTGCEVKCKFYRMAESTVVDIDGTVEDGKAVSVLEKACYDYTGRFTLTISIKQGEQSTTVFYGDGYMQGRSADTAITGEYIVYDIDTLLAKLDEIDEATISANTAAGNANTAAGSANTAAGAANTAAGNANDAASAATSAANAANDAATRIDGLTATAEGLTAGSAPTVNVTTGEDGVKRIEFGIPDGQRGAPGIIISETEPDDPDVNAYIIPNGTVPPIDAQMLGGKAPEEYASAETVRQLKDDLADITPDDTTVNGKPWTSKKTVDSLCLPFEATGNPVQCYPVEGYPLGVKVSWEPVQEGEGDPSPDNVRPITGRDSVSITIRNGMDSKTTDIALPETVYGGTLDVETGVVTVEKVIKTFTGDENITKEEGTSPDCDFFWIRNAIEIIEFLKKEDSVCTHFPIVSISYSNKTQGIDGWNKDIYIRYDSIATTVDEFRNYLTSQYAAGTPVKVSYKLKNPFAIQLDKNQIAALSGVNTLYTDSGTLTVTGREDPRHTIVTLTDRIAALESAASGV